MEKIREIEKSQLKQDLPNFGPGDTVKVHIKVNKRNFHCNKNIFWCSC